MSFNSTRIGELDCWLKKTGANTAHIILHGYGADYNDLKPLADEIRLGHQVDWIFPNAPGTVDNPFMSSGRAWFNIDMISWQQAAMGSDFVDFISNSMPEGLQNSVRLIKDLIEQTDYKQIYIGGFSQGSMIASHYAFRYPEKVKKLSILSGALIGKGELSFDQKTHAFNTFQSHGTQDQVIPYIAATAFNEWLKNYNPNHQLVSFAGGHGIDHSVLHSWQDFLNE